MLISVSLECDLLSTHSIKDTFIFDIKNTGGLPVPEHPSSEGLPVFLWFCHYILSDSTHIKYSFTYIHIFVSIMSVYK